MVNTDMNFWKGRKVLITGHTGFKGTWLALWLIDLGAIVSGISSPQESEQTIFTDLHVELNGEELYFDISDRQKLIAAMQRLSPEIVFHLAAQASVLKGYEDPVLTWSSNFIGSLNILEALNRVEHKTACVYVTTDKVYLNNESGTPFMETHQLGGDDPYSLSKIMAENLLTNYMQNVFLNKSHIRICAARAGNVIGGGDWLRNRIIPDVFRAVKNSSVLQIRNPYAIRPWQHVLDPLFGYMKLAEFLYIGENTNDFRAMNFGSGSKTLTVNEMVRFISEEIEIDFKVIEKTHSKLSEKNTLLLDSSLAFDILGWEPRMSQYDSIRKTTDWYMKFISGTPMLDYTLEQIRTYRE